ncbi:hypothetical protein ABB37_07604 [Leptomonas pyrrhocoris]|uniref:Uncharacterized protein n=1 Tax=Leptomonas pyrrhocoris TaxID=157538 RepID=A0A0M9FVL0_LEPPY|nr:hypothetical protein ABB37_07604 [Leptomonas pyrrhocoris]XP_015655225.1 hypothetical protein ABB37_07604 [Leptomonas pyrrhocoris]KPA76785.1 hypothetical protein ABB37_07604 [Leptomonas pyrrhocoris]KPA76786.1 hypothetical protein ABB37_07604 [Leptomonas pyrrhocoris]|eukprot:XP_015655224.1 hypothetical protein ABB37_07604 [Leptomonas pyrrhocoris]
MNPTASAYVPSSAIAETLHRRRPTPPTTPPIMAPTAARGSMTTAAVSANGAHLTAAERLRNLNSTAAPPSPPKQTVTSSALNSAAQTPVLTLTTAPPAPAASTSSAASSPPDSNDNTAAAAAHHGVIRYTKQLLLSLRPAAMEYVTRGPIVDHPPFLKIPEGFAHLLELPHALEYVNVDAATQLVEHRTYVSPLLSSFGQSRAAESNVTAETEDDIAHARLYNCAICAEGGPQPCPAIQRIIQRASKFAMSTKLGTALMQPALVVESLLRLALVFEAKQSSMRLRLLAERSPRVVHLVEEYLCGEGYHLPLPPVTAHEEWAAMNAMLKFDAIRDNKTRVITDLSKHWKKRRTQFEQFVHFFAFRDARPVRPAKNIITQSVKPGMVAMLTGDVTAVLLLHRLGFFIPPDYYWSVYPFLRQSLGEGTLAYDVVRHLGLYVSSVQPTDMYNPVERPRRLA